MPRLSEAQIEFLRRIRDDDQPMAYAGLMELPLGFAFLEGLVWIKWGDGLDNTKGLSPAGRKALEQAGESNDR